MSNTVTRTRLAVAAPGGTPPPVDTAGLRVDGRDVQVSGIRRITDPEHGPGTELRLTAMRDTATTVRVTGAFTEAGTVDPLGRPIAVEPVRDGLELALGPWEIRTVVLRG
ncbi:hypothetical protein ACIRQQ_30480 [Streptomyces fuscichromogenes]|uniref:hypothetical protein n=1 Tax=Streptomyces fuscichromogenes TaxID=1324013 RepID=UPI00380FE675